MSIQKKMPKLTRENGADRMVPGSKITYAEGATFAYKEVLLEDQVRSLYCTRSTRHQKNQHQPLYN